MTLQLNYRFTVYKSGYAQYMYYVANLKIYVTMHDCIYIKDLELIISHISLLTKELF